MARQKLSKQVEMVSPKGIKYAVFHEVDILGNDKGYGLWVLRANYSAGKTVHTWRYVQKNMSADEARLLMLKKCKA